MDKISGEHWAKWYSFPKNSDHTDPEEIEKGYLNFFFLIKD